VEFYSETLGWQLGTDERDVAGLSFGTGYLVIRADERKEKGRSFAGGMYVTVQVEDVDAEHTRLKALGIGVSELYDQPWGERNFTFTDPDGYLWSYSQATQSYA
jgi:uncharacterized glyoxalase superfamily protein PhnB